jgi:hypothetical protein
MRAILRALALIGLLMAIPALTACGGAGDNGEPARHAGRC